MNILMILTSHEDFGNSGRKTGFWMEEFAAPYYRFLDAGSKVTLASPQGDQPPVDAASMGEDFQTADTRRFAGDVKAQAQLASTLKLADISADDYDAVFYPGGHGPLFDLTDNAASLALLTALHSAGKPVGAVCHGLAALIKAKTADGTPLVKGHEVTGFTDSEEAAVGATDLVPYSVEQELAKAGGKFRKADDWANFAIRDGLIITGQNPASSASVADHLLAALKERG
ncbi:type 1 glutamine amidotransferase domain-containing protein [Kiloniella laminariae]|uniref:Type 1 glutamine amidotransferase domain-containing protein n=1 Tax=Kiloniella laminariae TaxID=454162 RepID=A0ABT4LF59_9PROT|nr:type 1 glutamine amidotransferase domain-containing protein [Kiloniella laminariae]MCZ4279727.1 type 1 glutamine amidotransferase domain-containing protein [Kiloniella laminariae]